MLFRSLGALLFYSPLEALGEDELAAAAPAPYRLQVVRGEGAGSCAQASVIALDVIARLGRDPFSAEAARAFEIELSHVDTVWRAKIYLRADEGDGDGDAVRMLESDELDCDELGRSVALAVALAIAPDAPAPAAPPEPEPAPPSPPPPPPPRSPVQLGRPEKARNVSLGLSLRGLASPNMLPAPSAGSALAATIRVGKLVGASVGALFFPESELEVSSARLGFGLTAAFVSGCLWARVADPQIFSCIGSRLGALHTVVYRPEPAAPGERWWWAMSSELALRQHFAAGIFVELGAAAVFPLVRYRFQAGVERANVYQQGPLVAEGFVGLGLRLN